MKFIFDLSYDSSPEFLLGLSNSFRCKYEMLTYLDFRTASTLAEAEHKHWYDLWFNSGVNHREERGMIVCEKDRCSCLVIEIQDLEELIELQTKYGCIEISNSHYLELPKEITIGDN